jgi:acyl-CoA reductase-like NAD-dependent aldehyde dehydrogenase
MGKPPSAPPGAPPTLALKPGTAWSDAWRRCRDQAPEAFPEDGHVLNLWGGRWHSAGEPRPTASPVDGTETAGPLMLDATDARGAVSAAHDRHRAWRHIPLQERRARVAATLDALAENRELLALLQVWETGTPWKTAHSDVDEAAAGVRWYVDRIESMLADRAPLPGPVSNVCGWNRPLGALFRTMLVQVLAGNAVLARAPADSGPACLTLACALAAREGLPLTLVSGGDRELSEPLIRAPEIACVCCVGAGAGAADAVASAAGHGKRHIVARPSLNCWGVWEFSDWQRLTASVRDGFAHAKQRSTAHTRFVVQRTLFAEFLGAYLAAVRSLRFGHPLAVAHPEDYPPDLDFGPLVSPGRARELTARISETVDLGAVPLHRGSLSAGHFLPAQDTSAYLPPTALLAPPKNSPLYGAPPLGPVDSFVLADTETKFLAAMNAGGGALAATLSTDDEEVFARLAPQVDAFETGSGRNRSRGDHGDPAGGSGSSWRGPYVGGELLVRAVTRGPHGESLPGNDPDHRLPLEAEPTHTAA